MLLLSDLEPFLGLLKDVSVEPASLGPVAGFAELSYPEYFPGSADRVSLIG